MHHGRAAISLSAVLQQNDVTTVGASSGSTSIRPVLEWYRKRISSNHFRRDAAVVPPAVAGWVIAQAGETSDADRMRPLGQVRRSLLRLAEEASLSERERRILEVRFGLTEYPANRPRRQLRHRVVPTRERNRDGLTPHRLSQLATSAIRKLDAALAERPLCAASQAAVAGPVPDPLLAPWFADEVTDAERRWQLFERAVHAAREFASVSGIGNEVEEVLVEIDEYHAIAREAWPNAPRRSRSRARALVSVALWDIVRDGPRPSAGIPSRTGLARSPASVTVVPEPVGAFLAGDWTDSNVLAACRAITDLARRAGEIDVAEVCASLLLHAYDSRGKRRLSERAAAAVLRTAVRVRATDDDPTAVGLARRMYVDRPHDWQTVDTLQAAVKVASAYGCYAIADELCDLADDVLSEPFRVPAGREIEVERIEYQQFTHHQRSGTLRRQLQDGGPVDALMRRAVWQNDAARRQFERAQELAQAGQPGDASDKGGRWAFFQALRTAELRLIWLEHRASGDAFRRGLRNVDELIAEAGEFAADDNFSELECAQLIKVRLAKALLEDEIDEAIARLIQLHELRWPIGRSVLAVLEISQPTEKRQRAPDRLREAVDVVAAAQRSDQWHPAGADTAGGWRRARTRLLGH